MSPLRETIDRWRDGALSVGDQALVVTQLRADPAAMQEFLAEVALDHQLAALVGDVGQAQHLARFDDAWKAATSVSGAQRTIAAVERAIDQRSTRPRSARSSARLPARSSAKLRAARRPQARWWPLVAFAAAAALVVMVLRPWETTASPITGPATIATLIRTDADTAIVRAGKPLTIAAGLDLHADDQVQVAGSAEILLSDGSLLTLSDGAGITLRSPQRIAQERGALTVQATHRAGDQALAVTTPHATASVVGTRFTVRVDGERTRLGVEDGTVRFAPTVGEAVLVTAGGSASAPPETLVRGVSAFRLVNARTGVPLPGYERVGGSATIPQATLRRTPIAVLALTTPDDLGPVRFSVDGRAIEPPQNDPPYSLTASQSLQGDQKFTPWTPTVGTHVLRAAPVSGGGTTATLTLTITGDPP